MEAIEELTCKELSSGSPTVFCWLSDKNDFKSVFWFYPLASVSSLYITKKQLTPSYVYSKLRFKLVHQRAKQIRERQKIACSIGVCFSQTSYMFIWNVICSWGFHLPQK